MNVYVIKSRATGNVVAVFSSYAKAARYWDTRDYDIQSWYVE